MKKLVRLTESELNGVIKGSVVSLIREFMEGDESYDSVESESMDIDVTVSELSDMGVDGKMLSEMADDGIDYVTFTVYYSKEEGMKSNDRDVPDDFSYDSMVSAEVSNDSISEINYVCGDSASSFVSSLDEACKSNDDLKGYFEDRLNNV